MTINAIRCEIIARVLRMDRAALLALQAAMVDLRRSAITQDLPEWIPASQAAEFLHLTPRHIRRICADQLHITYQRRMHNSALCWHLHRDLLRSLASSATLRQPRAKRAGKPGETMSDVRAGTTGLQSCLEPTLNAVVTASECTSSPEGDLQTTPDIPAASAPICKLAAAPAARP